MKENLFLKDIIIHNQHVKAIHFSTKFGEVINFNDLNENDFFLKYDVLIHNEDKRDHIIILEFRIEDTKKETKSPLRNEFHILVEGHYEVPVQIEDDNIQSAIHFASLSHLIAFLRSSVYSISSLMYGGGFQLPLINLEKLHAQFVDDQNKKKKRTKSVSKNKK